jgi:oxygen-independent coproporphyrinogen-3 oxidase
LGKRNWEKLKTFAEEGIIEFDAKGIKILPSGLPFIRNVCMVFDLRMQEKEERKFGFSKSI